MKVLDRVIFSSRWLLYPINIGLLIALSIYVVAFFREEYMLIVHHMTWDLESLMILMLSLVDASMVANLIVMVAQGGHQIFIRKFDVKEGEEQPQYLEHIDTGILKIKIALSISSITLVQILKDFVHLEKVDWVVAEHRMWMHGMTLLSALVLAFIWRITHPPVSKDSHSSTGGK